jgi:integrase
MWVGCVELIGVCRCLLTMLNDSKIRSAKPRAELRSCTSHSSETRGRHETAHRVRALAGRVFRYAVATGRAQHDVAADLKDALAPVKSKNFASVMDPSRVGELRATESSEFDMAGAEWRTPAARMKMREAHIVPLARKALSILEELEPLARGRRYLNWGIQSGTRCAQRTTRPSGCPRGGR